MRKRTRKVQERVLPLYATAIISTLQDGDCQIPSVSVWGRIEAPFHHMWIKMIKTDTSTLGDVRDSGGPCGNSTNQATKWNDVCEQITWLQTSVQNNPIHGSVCQKTPKNHFKNLTCTVYNWVPVSWVLSWPTPETIAVISWTLNADIMLLVAHVCTLCTDTPSLKCVKSKSSGLKAWVWLDSFWVNPRLFKQNAAPSKVGYIEKQSLGDWALSLTQLFPE